MSTLAARLTVPGSKSHTNRALLLAALAEGVTTLQGALFADDTRYFAQALEQLGFVVKLEPHAQAMTVHGLGGRIPTPLARISVGNAGTAARFLTALLTLGQGEYHLDGVERMRQRPIGDLVNALNLLGAHVSATRHHHSLCPPVTVRASGLPGGNSFLRGEVSSQFLSALLMVAPYARQPVEIRVEGPLHSKPYVDLTLDVMADFGVLVERDGYAFFQVKPQRYSALGGYPIEPDASAASYFFAAPAVCGGWVEVTHLSRTARQGDIAFLSVLEQMGCTVLERTDGIRVHGPEFNPLRGVDVDMSNMSDTFLTLAAIAPFAETPTTIRGVASSRFKETDRVAAAVTELRRLGVKVDEHPDGLTVYPGADLHPARIHTYDDHRVAMAFALVGLRLPRVEIENPGCVAKTFPAFFETLEQIRPPQTAGN